MRRAAVLAGMLALAPSALAHDPGPGDPAKAIPYERVWSFDAVGATAPGGCNIRFFAAGGYGQFDLVLLDACIELYPFLARIGGWRPDDDGFLLAYGAGGVAIAFHGGPDGGLGGEHRVADRGDGTRYAMRRAGAAVTPVQGDIEAMAGDYNLWPPENAAESCRLTLSAMPGLRATLAEDCGFDPGAVARWRLERAGEIVFDDAAGHALGRFVQMEGAQDATGR